MNKSNLSKLLKTLGPGIVFAGMCVGVSHLVQSTRAGADYGFLLLPAVIAAVVFKYPFFEFSSRYTSATGVSILHGYEKKGRWILWIYAIVTFLTMFIVTAAVTFVAAGLMSSLFQLDLGTDVLSAILLILCVAILVTGRYNALDGLLKVVSVVLLLSTILAVTVAIFKDQGTNSDYIPDEIWSTSGIAFLIALMGWMPTAVDMSTWTGLWAEERVEQTNYQPTLKETLLDFNVGYILTGVLAVIFLSLGALVMYGSGVELSNSSAGFAEQLIGMYTSSIGEWSYLVIAIAAFSTMFSTTITVVDGYGRACGRTIEIFNQAKSSRVYYIISVIVIAFGGWIVISRFLNNLKSLVDLATTVSFIIAPFAAYLNYYVITDKDISKAYQPPLWLRYLAIAGIIFLSAFTLVYFYVLWM